MGTLPKRLMFALAFVRGIRYLPFCLLHAQILRKDKCIKGLDLPGGLTATCTLYMDDVTLLCSDVLSAQRALDLTDWYGRASGAKLNKGKSEAQLFGSWGNERTHLDIVFKENVLNLTKRAVDGDREKVSPVPGLTLDEAKQVWRNAAHPALQNWLKDLAWMAAHEILPVRAVMHSRGMAKNPVCPRPGTVKHVLWECSVARDLWALTGPLQCPSLPAGVIHRRVYRLAVNGVGQSISKLPAGEFTSLWLTLMSVTSALWTACNLLVGKRVTVPLHAILRLAKSFFFLPFTVHGVLTKLGL
ncbi:hypothetical protein MHYP_G00148230 [Metynnis hypsauchen]